MADLIISNLTDLALFLEQEMPVLGRTSSALDDNTTNPILATGMNAARRRREHIMDNGDPMPVDMMMALSNDYQL